jgi:hypothetical protein
LQQSAARSGRIYGRICKSKTSWCSRGARRIKQFSGTLLDTLRNERQEMRKLMAALHAFSSGEDGEAQTDAGNGGFARTLLALARTLDSHVERYDAEVLPSILRALFHK